MQCKLSNLIVMESNTRDLWSTWIEYHIDQPIMLIYEVDYALSEY